MSMASFDESNMDKLIELNFNNQKEISEGSHGISSDEDDQEGQAAAQTSKKRGRRLGITKI